MLFKLIPLIAIFKNPSMSCRSLRYSPLIFTDCHCLAVEWRSCRRLRKWCTNGIAIPRWMSQPIFVSSIFVVVVPSLIIDSIAVVQAVNLLSDRMIKSHQKLMSQPRIVFVSYSKASDSSLFLASIVSLEMGLLSSRGREHMSNMRRGALLHWMRLSEPSTSTVNETKSLMYMSFIPRESTLMSTISSLHFLNGIWSSNLLGGGTRCWFLPNSIIGSHYSLCRIAVVRSHMISDIIHQKLEQSLLPNVSRRFIKANNSSLIWVTVFDAVNEWRWQQR